MKSTVFFYEEVVWSVFQLFPSVFIQHSSLVLWIITTSPPVLLPSLLCLSAAGRYVHTLLYCWIMFLLFFCVVGNFLLPQEFSSSEYDWWNCCSVVLETESVAPRQAEDNTALIKMLKQQNYKKTGVLLLGDYINAVVIGQYKLNSCYYNVEIVML